MFIDNISSAGPYVPQSVQAASGGFTQTSAAGQTAAPPIAQTILYSPSAIKVDPVSHLVIFEQRNPETGEVTHQYPSQKVVDEYRKLSEGEATAASVEITNAITGGGVSLNTLSTTGPIPVFIAQPGVGAEDNTPVAPAESKSDSGGTTTTAAATPGAPTVTTSQSA